MPELPEVETIRRGIEPALKGRTIARVELRRKDLRIPFPENMREQLEGQKIKAVRRRSKYLLIDTPHNTLILHLGMSGKILLKDKPPATPEKHDHVIFTFDNGSALVFNDARRFGLMTLCATDTLEKHKLLANLGPEPLSKEFSSAYFLSVLEGRSVAIKQAIMDACVVVGVGNIYASESLFRAHIHPKRKAARITKQEAPKLIGSIREVLEEAIASGGSTLRDYVRSDGDLGYFQHRFRVYGRENKPCYACGDAVQRTVQQGRSTYHCPTCQPR